MASSADGEWVFSKRFIDEEADDVEEGGVNEKTKDELKQEAKDAGMVEYKEWKNEFKKKMKEYFRLIESIPESMENSPFDIPKEKEIEAHANMYSWSEDTKRKFRTIMNKNESEREDQLIDFAYDAVEKASRATCLVRCDTDSETRKEGTGLLVLFKSKFSPSKVFVITNNHVIMDEVEAESAKVYFDYNKDIPEGKLLSDFPSEIKTFSVEKLFAYSPRTKNSKDETTLDYSLLSLVVSEGDSTFLTDRALDIGRDIHVLATGNELMQKYAERKLPLIMFSHPYGLSKRLSIGPFPTLEENPVKHIKHTLGTSPGCSGGNLLFCPITSSTYGLWQSAFVHYRHGKAVAWQSIKDHLNKCLEKENTGNRE